MANVSYGPVDSFTPEAAITTFTDNSGGVASNTIPDQSTWGTALTDSTGATPSTTISDGDTQGTALTDNSTGAVGTTLAAGVGQFTHSVYFRAAAITGNVLLYTYIPGYKFKILKISASNVDAVTTGAKAATLTTAINGVNTTGGVVVLSGTYALGAEQASSAAITAANTGTNAQAITVTASAVTAFVEGGFMLHMEIQNMDSADAIASLSAKSNLARTDIGTLNTSCSSLATKINLGITDAGNVAIAAASFAAKTNTLITTLRAQGLINTA